jgi:hypothetical protein
LKRDTILWKHRRRRFNRASWRGRHEEQKGNGVSEKIKTIAVE